MNGIMTQTMKTFRHLEFACLISCIAAADRSCLALEADLEREAQEFSSVLRMILDMPSERRASEMVSLAESTDFHLAAIGNQMVYFSSGFAVPSLLVGNKPGWVSAVEKEPLLDRIFPVDHLKRDRMSRAILAWSAAFTFDPEKALRSIMPRNVRDSSTTSTIDIVHLVALILRQPGVPLRTKISKPLWSRFHQASNPCSRIMALEKFDSTDQSPAELLSLYRECLFQTFGYLQVRALEGIYRSRDFRPEVAALLQEFLGSNPVKDDGTLPGYPDNFGNPVDGAKWLLAEMTKAPGTPPALPPKPAVFPAVPPEARPTAAQPSGGAFRPDGTSSPRTGNDVSNSMLWSIIAALSMVVLLLLWLLLKLKGRIRSTNRQ